ncbi:MAG: hypothetical protein FJ298_02750 [Planctomycetes bacterium]|nr:hypothetical protein [Planctomycetota bacterium]
MGEGQAWLGFGAAAVIVVVALSRAWRAAGLWIALAIAGQAAALSLYVAGPTVTYQHLRLEGERASVAAAVLAVLVQTVCVAVALGRRASEVRAFAGRVLVGWRALAFVALLALAAAKLARPAERSLLEFAAATSLHLVALGNLALAAMSLPPAALARLEDWLARVLGRRGASVPEPGRLDAFAWTCAGVAFALALACNVFAYERSPHVPDEIVYLLQARYFAVGELWLAPRSVPAAFDLDLMLLDQGKWYCPVPPGWPLVLSIGVRLGVPWLVNPLLGAASVLLGYLFLRELVDRRTARIGTVLLATSPWFTFLNMSFMTHALTLLCALLASLAVARARRTQGVALCIVGGAALGVIALIRPLDGLIVAAAAGLWALGWGGARLRVTALGTFIAAAAAVGALTLPYNAALTGRASSFPIQHYVDVVYGPGKNDLGFGPDKGLGWGGLDPWEGHSPHEALVTSQFNLFALDAELFGWACGSLALVWLALLGARRSRTDRAMATFVFAVIGSSWLYWFNGGPDFGARYWYLAIVPLVWFTLSGLRRASEACAAPARAEAFVGVAVLASLATWTPWRACDKYRDYRGVRPSQVAAAQLRELRDALVLVEGRRHPEFAQAALLNRFEDPRSTATFAWLRDVATLDALLAAMPNRTLYCLRSGQLVGPLTPEAAREIAAQAQGGTR